MKTMIFWLEKRCRKPMMRGLATAECSAGLVEMFRGMAREGRGRLFIVEGETAEQGRRLIAGHKAGIGRHPMTAVVDDGRTVAIGTNAVLAMSGAADSVRRWDDRIRERGRVTVDESRALPRSLDDALGRLSPENIFRGGLER